jgi:hypothetical protein
MTWTNVFSTRTSARRPAKRAARSAHDLTRRFAFKPRMEYLEDRLAPAGGALTLTVNGLVTASTIYGQSVAFAGTAAGLSNPNTNNGDVIQIKNGASVLSTATLNVAAPTSLTGSFTVSTSTIAKGTYSVVAHDSTDTTVTDSTPADSLTVAAAHTSVTVTPVPASVVSGQTLTFTAKVANTDTTAVKPTGTLQFKIDGVNFGSAVALSGGAGSSTSVSSGSTSFTVASGAHTITATYANTDGNFVSSNGSTTLTATQASSTTSDVTASANPSVFGQVITFSATVTATAPGGGVPTGTVTFLEGATTLGTGTLAGGTAKLTIGTLSTASHTVTASYGGDTNFTGSDDTASATPLVQVVNQASSKTTVTSGQNPYDPQQTATFTATVAGVAPSTAGTPSGTVNFTLDGSPITANPVALSGGKATFTASGLSAGNHTVTAGYSGDTNYTTSTSANFVQSVAILTTTTVTFDHASSVYGQGFKATATVSDLFSGNPTPPTGGSVLFTDTIVTNADSSGHFLLGGKLTLTIGLVSVGAGGTAVLNASLTGSPAVVLPGVITDFLSNGQPANTSPVNHIIKGQYTGSGSFFGSNPSLGKAETISKDSTQTTFAVTPSPAQFGQVVTMTATVKSLGGSLMPAIGTVTFKDSYTIGGTTTNTTLGTVSLPSASPGTTSVQATFTTSTLTQAAHSLSVFYNGDNTAPFPLPTSFPFRGQWLTSSVTGFGLVVQADQTTATLSANPASSQQLAQSITFVDSLTSPGGAPHSGTVTFKDGTTVLGSSGVNIRGKATLIYNPSGSVKLLAGPHTFTAFYAGSSNFKASTSNNLAYTITAGPSTTTITGPSTSPTTTITINNAFTLTAKVAGATGFPAPTGSVVFVVESNHRDAVAPSGPIITPFTLGTATLAGGIASLAMPSGLPLADVYELESFYGGDTNYLAGHSASVTPGGGPVAFELAIKDTGIAFRGFPLVRPNGFGAGTIEVLGKVRPSAEIGQPPPTAGNLTSSPATGGVGGHIKMFLDGVQTTTAGHPSTPQITSNSGSFALGTAATPGQHVIVLQ